VNRKAHGHFGSKTQRHRQEFNCCEQAYPEQVHAEWGRSLLFLKGEQHEEAARGHHHGPGEQLGPLHSVHGREKLAGYGLKRAEGGAVSPLLHTFAENLSSTEASTGDLEKSHQDASKGK
jgi:hypothetical protein